MGRIKVNGNEMDSTIKVKRIKKEKPKIFVNVYPDKDGKLHVVWDICGSPTENQLASMLFMLELAVDRIKNSFNASLTKIEDKDL